MKKRIKKFIRERVCANWERTIGPVGILACDLSLSINLLRKRSPAEQKEHLEFLAEIATKHPVPSEAYFLHQIPTYGITVEPFGVHLMGSDGDVCWSSPGWYLTNWVFSDGVSEDDDILPNGPDSGEPVFGFLLGV